MLKKKTKMEELVNLNPVNFKNKMIQKQVNIDVKHSMTTKVWLK